MRLKYVIAACLLVIVVAGCRKTDDGIISTFDTDITNNAMLKINIASIYRSNPSMRIKINDQIVSGLLTARTPFPGGGYNTGGDNVGTYLAVPGNRSPVKVSLMIPFVGDTSRRAQDSVSLYETSIDVTNGKYYSLHIADTASKTKSVLFEENLALPTDTLPYFKFVNLIPNIAGAGLDLYFGDSLLATGIKYLESSNEFAVNPRQASTAWTVRQTGLPASAPAIATYTSGNTYIRGRKYTAFAMGYFGLSGTTEPRRPFISFYYIR